MLIVVKDEGEGFDLAQVPSPLLGENIHSEHGRGIYLVRMGRKQLVGVGGLDGR